MSVPSDRDRLLREVHDGEAVGLETSGVTDSLSLKKRGAAFWDIGEASVKLGRLGEAVGSRR